MIVNSFETIVTICCIVFKALGFLFSGVMLCMNNISLQMSDWAPNNASDLRSTDVIIFNEAACDH